MSRRIKQMLQLAALGIAAIAPHAQGGMTTPGQFGVSPSGAATYSIPIQVPPGTGGIEPKLALNYNSQSGNGLLGIGWSLGGLSAISRCARTMAQDGVRGSINYDNNDRYCLDGQRLIALPNQADGGNGTEYRTELDGFAKIVSYGTAGNGPAWFKVWTKAGQVMEYGNTADSRIELPSNVTVRTWALNKLQDTKGNYLTVTYSEDTSGLFYAQRIDYTGNAINATAPLNSVSFEYETRPDVETAYSFGTKVSRSLRLKAIKTRQRDTIVKGYFFTYGASTLTGRTELVEANECPAGVMGNNCLPKTLFEMEQGTEFLSLAPGGIGGTHAYWDAVVDSPTYKGKVFTGDFNGDGRTDVAMIYRDPNSSLVSIYEWFADPNGQLVFHGMGSGGTHAYWDAVVDSPTYKGKVFTGDFNGDGRTDVAMIYRDPNSSLVSIYEWFADPNGQLVFHGMGSGGTHAYWDAVVDSPTYKGKVFTGDFNGDGRTDVAMIYRDPNSPVVSIYEWFADETGKLTLAPGGIGGTHAYWDAVVDSPTYKGKVFTGDFNGDGRTDVAMIYRDPNSSLVSIYEWFADPNGQLVFHGMGSGGTHAYWDAVVDSPTYKGKVFTGDFNGDGRTDVAMIYRDPNSSLVSIYEWFADETGKLTLAPGGIGGTHAYWDAVVDSPTYKGKVFTGDFNGDGRTDVAMIYRDPNSSLVSIYEWFADPNGQLVFHGMGSGGTHAYWDAVIDSPTYKGQAFEGDFNGDGKTDIAMIYRDPNSPTISIYHWNTNGPHGDLLKSVNSLDNTGIAFSYQPVSNSSVYKKDTGPNASAYPKVDIQSPQYVVSSVTSPNGSGGTLTTTYTYGGLKAEVGTGRGLLGFRWMKTTQQESGISSYSEFRQDYPYTGLPSLTKKTIAGGGNNGLLNQINTDYGCLDPATGGACAVAPGHRYFPYAKVGTETSWDLDGSALPTIITASQYDNWGNATQISVSSSDGYSKTTVNSYAPADTVNWYLGRLTKATVTSTAP